MQEKNIYVDKSIKLYIGIPIGLFIINIVFGFYLDQFDLLFSQRGEIFGTGYTDLKVRLFATYHMIDPKIFYNKDDLWGIPIYAASVYMGESLETLAKKALRTYNCLNELQRQGDWAGYGEQLKISDRF